MTSSGIEPATSRLGAQCLLKLRSVTIKTQGIHMTKQRTRT